MTEHRLKTINPYFDLVWNGKKTAELRYDDRGYQVGDTLLLVEYCVDNDSYSNRVIQGVITHILKDFDGLTQGWVMLSFETVWTGEFIG